MSTKNYNRPMSAEEQRQLWRAAMIAIPAGYVFMIVLTALVHAEKIKLYPSSISADMVKGFAGRVEFALRYQTLLVAWLMFNIIATIYVRVTKKALNPLEEKSEQNVLLVKAVLNNSYEQIILSVLAQLIYVSFATPECILKVIPLVNILQFIGRIAFFYGYPMKRAFGFHVTAAPTLVLVIYNIYAFVIFLAGS